MLVMSGLVSLETGAKKPYGAPKSMNLKVATVTCMTFHTPARKTHAVQGCVAEYQKRSTR